MMQLGEVSARFIVFEGVDGSGKSTVIPHVAEYLRSTGRELVLTREPGGCDLAEQLRSLLLESGEHALDIESELLLMLAARRQHLSEVIIPALQRGSWVICDRFNDSTYAYQGAGRGLDAARIAAIEHAVGINLLPDLVVLLDVDCGHSRQRLASRSLGRFECEDQAFFERVRACYLQRAENCPERYALIDARRSFELVVEQVLTAIKERFA